MLLPLLPLIPNFTGVWFRLTGTTSASGQLHSLDDGGNNHPKPHRFFQAVPKMFSQFNSGAASRKEASTLHGLEAREGPAQFFDRLNLLECEPASSSGQDADEVDQSQLSKVYPPWVTRTITEKDMHCDMPLINILTSLPFFVMANVKDREKHGMTAFANSMYGVGIAATSYHGVGGPCRAHCRWVDYLAIGLATTAMNTALFPNRPHYYAPAMVALTPFHPLKVTVANILLLEGTLAHRSLRHESIRMATLKHYAIAAVSGAFFVRDEEWAHPIWHLGSCAAISSVIPIVKAVRHIALRAHPL